MGMMNDDGNGALRANFKKIGPRITRITTNLKEFFTNLLIRVNSCNSWEKKGFAISVPSRVFAAKI
jgi:hypothetical protein